MVDPNRKDLAQNSSSSNFEISRAACAAAASFGGADSVFHVGRGTQANTAIQNAFKRPAVDVGHDQFMAGAAPGLAPQQHQTYQYDTSTNTSASRFPPMTSHCGYKLSNADATSAASTSTSTLLHNNSTTNSVPAPGTFDTGISTQFNDTPIRACSFDAALSAYKHAVPTHVVNSNHRLAASLDAPVTFATPNNVVTENHVRGKRPGTGVITSVSHEYCDYGKIPDEVALKEAVERKNTGGVITTFPEKLHQLLSSGTVEPDVIGWAPHGRCFLVRKPKEFATTIMPQNFKHTKLTSFQRQLNLYGFKRITKGKDRGAYYNELFLRGRPKLCSMMRRKKVKGTGHKPLPDPDNEPNFYLMEPLDGPSSVPIKEEYQENGKTEIEQESVRSKGEQDDVPDEVPSDEATPPLGEEKASVKQMTISSPWEPITTSSAPSAVLSCVVPSPDLTTSEKLVPLTKEGDGDKVPTETCARQHPSNQLPDLEVLAKMVEKQKQQLQFQQLQLQLQQLQSVSQQQVQPPSLTDMANPNSAASVSQQRPCPSHNSAGAVSDDERPASPSCLSFDMISLDDRANNDRLEDVGVPSTADRRVSWVEKMPSSATVFSGGSWASSLSSLQSAQKLFRKVIRGGSLKSGGSNASTSKQSQSSSRLGSMKARFKKQRKNSSKTLKGSSSSLDGLSDGWISGSGNQVEALDNIDFDDIFENSSQSP